jgi:hypothetical protein
MKVELHTSPVAEAFLSQDECPFCRLEKEAQQRAIRFFAGPSASYMEPGIRGLTNRLGFCSDHMKKLYDYGNVLGTALMLQSHMEDILLDLAERSKQPEKAEKTGFFQKKNAEKQSTAQHLRHRAESCAVCNQVEESMDRHYKVFFALLSEPEFRKYVEESKGFCLRHFARLLQEADSHLPNKYAQWFYPTVYGVMQENLARVKADLDLLIAKHDYRNAGLDWGNAKDSVPRAMQKLAGIYPADAPYKKE